jgi:hypothetical protein
MRAGKPTGCVLTRALRATRPIPIGVSRNAGVGRDYPTFRSFSNALHPQPVFRPGPRCGEGTSGTRVAHVLYPAVAGWAVAGIIVFFLSCYPMCEARRLCRALEF